MWDCLLTLNSVSFLSLVPLSHYLNYYNFISLNIQKQEVSSLFIFNIALTWHFVFPHTHRILESEYHFPYLIKPIGISIVIALILWISLGRTDILPITNISIHEHNLKFSIQRSSTSFLISVQVFDRFGAITNGFLNLIFYLFVLVYTKIQLIFVQILYSELELNELSDYQV